MKQFNVRLSTVNDVKDFVKAVSLCDYDVDLISGRYAVDAKSIIGIFSLDLAEQLTLKIHSDDCDDLLAEIDRFLAE